MPSASSHILIVAGEVSGDFLGGALTRQLKEQQPDIHVAAMGMSELRKAGAEILIPAEQLAVMGIFAVIKQLPALFRAQRTLKRYLKDQRPDLLILIDYPSFNMRLARYAKKLGIRVFYYVSPKIWAWKARRIHTLKKCVDHMAVLFEFEVDIYKKAGIPVTFVGHPLIDSLGKTPAPPRTDHRPCIALLPGSRRQEISRLLPVMSESVRALHKKHPDARFILIQAPGVSDEQITAHLPQDVTIEIVSNEALNTLIPQCDAAIVTSGTATLHVGIHACPMIVLYKLSPISYWIGRALIRTPFISLCNIICEKKVTQELIQHDATSAAVTDDIHRILTDQNYRQQMTNDLHTLNKRLGDGRSAHKAAEAALHTLLSSV